MLIEQVWQLGEALLDLGQDGLSRLAGQPELGMRLQGGGEVGARVGASGGAQHQPGRSARHQIEGGRQPPPSVLTDEGVIAQLVIGVVDEAVEQ